jgi:sarcosine oxidase, subunit gamma
MRELSNARRDEPLVGRHLAVPGGRLEIAPAAPAARYILRCKPEHAALIDEAFGVPIPTLARRAGVRGSRAALWLGPDEWLLIAEEGAQRAIEVAFAALARRIALSLVGVDHRNVAIELLGPAAADVISVGCPLDLGNDAYPPGTCARTLFSNCEIVLWRTEHRGFRMEFWRSCADHVWRLLDIACADIATTVAA